MDVVTPGHRYLADYEIGKKIEELHKKNIQVDDHNHRD